MEEYKASICGFSEDENASSSYFVKMLSSQGKLILQRKDEMPKPDERSKCIRKFLETMKDKKPQEKHQPEMFSVSEMLNHLKT